jgi:hypothetical protein
MKTTESGGFCKFLIVSTTPLHRQQLSPYARPSDPQACHNSLPIYATHQKKHYNMKAVRSISVVHWMRDVSSSGWISIVRTGRQLQTFLLYSPVLPSVLFVQDSKIMFLTYPMRLRYAERIVQSENSRSLRLKHNELEQPAGGENYKQLSHSRAAEKCKAPRAS